MNRKTRVKAMISLEIDPEEYPIPTDGYVVEDIEESIEQHFHEINGDNSKTIDIMNSYGLAFKSGDTKTGTPVKIPGDDRKTWIRLSVGPDIDKMLFVGDIV